MSLLQTLRFAAARRWQEHKFRELERRGFRRVRNPLRAGESVLVVGSGASASAEAVAAVAGDYDTVVTMNNARLTAPDADIHCIEFAYRHPEVFEAQCEVLPALAYDRAVIKPLSVTTLSDEQISRLQSIWKEHGGGHPPAFLHHYQIRGVLAASRPAMMVSRDRDPYQWRGSLTVWLDMAWLAGVSRVGLIGTDLGTLNADGSFDQHLTNRNFHGEPGVLGILETLRKAGYLDGIAFDHHHHNDVLKNLLT